MSKPAIVFFGNEKLATGVATPSPLIRNATVEAGFELEQLVTGRLSELKPHKSKIAVLAAYGRIIPKSLLDEFPLGIINIHPSLLPQYRGPTPIEQALLDGVSKTGVSIMHLTAGMDEGPVYMQKSLDIGKHESKQSLTNRLQALGAELIKEILYEIYSGIRKPRQQPHPDRATYSHKIAKEDGEVDFFKDADVLEREIRAYAGWPRSHTQLADFDVIITSANTTSLPDEDNPGEIKVEKKQLFLGTGDGWLEILALQVPGKKEMSAEAFLAGYGTKLR